MGLGQVMASTAAAYGITDRSKLNPAQQADLSMRVLGDNLKRTGNIRDAVAMYHSGTTYDEAARRHLTDGQQSTTDYVDSILGA